MAKGLAMDPNFDYWQWLKLPSDRERVAEDREDREAYAEQAWEMRANEINPPSFNEWKAHRARIRELFDKR